MTSSNDLMDALMRLPNVNSVQITGGLGPGKIEIIIEGETIFGVNRILDKMLPSKALTRGNKKIRIDLGKAYLLSIK
jgi:hypothetical protein